MTALFVATGDAVMRVADGRAEAVLEEAGAQCVAVDAQNPDRVLAGCRGGGVFESEDGGTTWRDAGLPTTDVFSVAYSPADGAAYAGCEPSALWARRNGDWEELSALRELPSAPTWSFPPRPWTSHVRWIAPSPHDAEVVLAGIELGGLMRTSDGGATWEDHRPGAQRDVHSLAWHPTEPGRAYEAAGGGSAWSRDDGESWEGADDGRDRHYTWALAVDPADPDCWFVSAAPGPVPRARRAPIGPGCALSLAWSRALGGARSRAPAPARDDALRARGDQRGPRRRAKRRPPLPEWRPGRELATARGRRPHEGRRDGGRVTPG